MAVNEFRKDIGTGEWVLISSLRAKRPHDGARDVLTQSIEQCFFEPSNLHKQSNPIALYNQGAPVEWSGDWQQPWTTAVIKNKYPALQSGVCGAPRAEGVYLAHEAFGFHELVITRDHESHFAQFSPEQTQEVLMAYRNRYEQISADSCGEYVSIFHNHGRAAGASVAHNHSQIISTPFVPPIVLQSLQSADEYFQQHGKTVHQEIIDFEMRHRGRVVFENELFIAFCPYASKAGYEVRIFPKYEQSRFETATAAQLLACAQALNGVLKALFVALDNVDYNFYLHTAPVERDPLIVYDYYRWHIVITPRIPIAAGFELSTAIYLNPFDPDDAAQHLRSVQS